MTLAHPVALGFVLICLVGMLVDRRPVTELVATGVMGVAMTDGMVAEVPGLPPVAWSGVLIGVGLVSAVVSRVTGRRSDALGARLSLILCAVLVLAVDGHASSSVHHGGISLAAVVVLAIAGQLVISSKEILDSLWHRPASRRRAMIAPLAMIGSVMAMGGAVLGW